MLLQTALCAAVAAATCGAVYALKHPPTVSPLYGVAMGALFAAVLQAARAGLIEREYTVRSSPAQPLYSKSSAFPTEVQNFC